MRFTSKLQPIIRAKETARMIIALRSIRKNLALNALFRLGGHERKSRDVHDKLSHRGRTPVRTRVGPFPLANRPWAKSESRNSKLRLSTSDFRWAPGRVRTRSRDGNDKSAAPPANRRAARRAAESLPARRPNNWA